MPTPTKKVKPVPRGRAVPKKNTTVRNTTVSNTKVPKRVPKKLTEENRKRISERTKPKPKVANTKVTNTRQKKPKPLPRGKRVTKKANSITPKSLNLNKLSLNSPKFIENEIKKISPPKKVMPEKKVYTSANIANLMKPKKKKTKKQKEKEILKADLVLKMIKRIKKERGNSNSNINNTPPFKSILNLKGIKARKEANLARIRAKREKEMKNKINHPKEDNYDEEAYNRMLNNSNITPTQFSKRNKKKNEVDLNSESNTDLDTESNADSNSESDEESAWKRHRNRMESERSRT